MRAESGRRLGAVAMGCLSDLAGLRELGQAVCDAFGIEVQAFGEMTGGAPRVLGEEVDDARLGVALTAARGCAPIARSSRGRPAR